MTRTATKRIADMVARVLSGTETEHDRTGEGMYAYARCLVGAWVTRAQKAEATVQCLRGVISPQADETGESFALSVRGVMALLMSQERTAAAALQARIDAYAELVERIEQHQAPRDLSVLAAWRTAQSPKLSTRQQLFAELDAEFS